MAWRDWGSKPINSTGGTTAGSYGLETNPSTATLIAELDSTQLGQVLSGGSMYLVTWVVGASTNCIWQLEQASSTDLSIAPRNLTYVQTPSNQSGQYQLTYKLEKGDRLRCRPQAAITGVATAQISAEPIT